MDETIYAADAYSYVAILHSLMCRLGFIVLNIYRSDTVNSKLFISKVLLRIKWKFEQHEAIVTAFDV